MGFPENRILAVKSALQIIDAVFAMFVVTPLVVGYWRGIWQLLDRFLYPDDKPLSILISTVVGIVVPFILSILRDWLQEKCLKPTAFFYVFSRIYTFVFAFACVNNWRSMWAFLDHYTGTGYYSTVPSIATGIVCLSLIGCLRNIVSSPLFIATDSPATYFTFSTMFQVPPKCGIIKSTFDCLFTVIINGYLVVAVWRGSFHFLDITLFPDDHAMSAWGSMIIGYSCSLIVMLLQKPVSIVIKRLSGLTRIVFLDLYNLVAFVGSVNAWRGLWNVYDVYLWPEHHFASNITTAVVGFLALTLFGASHSVLVRGVIRDGCEKGGKSAYFYYHYFLNNAGDESTVSLADDTREKNEKGILRDGEVSKKLLVNNSANDSTLVRETVV